MPNHHTVISLIKDPDTMSETESVHSAKKLTFFHFYHLTMPQKVSKSVNAIFILSIIIACNIQDTQKE
jgi:hypothetical protein